MESRAQKTQSSRIPHSHEEQTSDSKHTRVPSPVIAVRTPQKQDRAHFTKNSAWVLAVTASIMIPVATTNILAQGQDEDESAKRRRLMLELYDEALLPTDDRFNAALAYRKAFDLLAGIPDLSELTDTVYAQMESDPSRAVYQGTAVRRLLEVSSEAIELARLGANLKYAEFGTDRAQGFNMLMPHISTMRNLSRLMTIQSRAMRANGHSEESADVVADLLRMSRHAASDDVLIGSLVGVSCATLAFESIEDAVARGELDPMSAQRLLSGLDADTEDQFSFANAIESEYGLLIDSITEMEDPGFELGELLGSVSNNEDSLMLMDFEREELLEMIDQMGPAYTMAAEAFREPDPAKARLLIDQLETELGDGTYGAVATIFMPSLSRALESKLHTDEQIKGFEKMLRAIASGEDPARFANAAVIYEPAFAYLRRIRTHDQELLEMIRRVVAVTGSCEALPESMLDSIRSSLEESAPLIAMLRTAARFERCEWNEVEWSKRQGRIIAEGDWVRPMRAAARLLLADAALALCLAQASGEDEQEQAARSLADALAVALHMADGSHLFGEVTAAATLSEVADMIGSASESGVLDREAANRFERRLARLDGADPLGWKSARESMMRQDMLELIMSFGLKDVVAAERLVRNWPMDRLIVLAFFKKSSGPGEDSRFTLDIDGPDRGDLFEVEDVITIDDEGLALLQKPHTRLIELLSAADSAKPIKAQSWRSRSMESLGRITEAIRTIKTQEPGTADTP